MLKKTVTYTDYEGKEKTETLLFNLTRAEAYELLASLDDETIQYLDDAAKRAGDENTEAPVPTRKDRVTILKFIKQLIMSSYGVRTEDGHFMKSPELSASFAASEAYSELFMTFMNDDGAAAAFFNGLIPQGMNAKAIKAVEADA